MKIDYMQEYLSFAKDIAHKAEKIMLKYYTGDNGSFYKFDNTIVTKADTEINHYLIEQVKKHYPTHSVDGEEEQFGKSSHVWVCDPVDGTAMYARHIPVATFSLALVIDGKPVLGVVYDPFSKNLYEATKGGGSFLNGEKISVSKTKLNDMQSVSNFDMWPEATYDTYDAIHELGLKTYFLSIGSAVHACMEVAKGNFTFELFSGGVHKNCDVAAAKIIVEEAGGKVTDLFGNDQRYDQDINGCIVSNGVVHDDVVKSLKKHTKKLN